MEYAADFETNTTEETCALNPVWAWGVAEVGDNDGKTYIFGLSIDSFMVYIEAHAGRYWFHNAKFDCSFIIYWLFTHGYKHTRDRTPLLGEFTTLISSTGRFYHMKIAFESGAICEFADSYNKLPMRLEQVAGAYGLEMSKGEIDYSVYRPPGHALTSEESDYLRRDVLILAAALERRFEMGERLTTGADCLAVARDMFGRGNWVKLFPQVPPEVDADMRRAYRGGYVYANPAYTEKRVGEGASIDVNSLYPYIMRERPMPWGEWITKQGKPAPNAKYCLWIAEVSFSFDLKAGKLPCIQVKGDKRFKAREYQSECKDYITMMVTNVDWDLINECYNVDVMQWGVCYYFRASSQLFDAYVDQGMQGKMNAKSPGERQNFKLWLNNLYGKYSQKIVVKSKVPVMVDGVVRYRETEPELRKGVYLPVGIFITSWARDYTIRTAMEFGDRFLYSDTDSIHFLGYEIPADVRVDDKELGAWKVEGKFTEAVYLRAKTYAEKIGGKWHYTCAGMVDGLKAVMDINDFHFGFSTDPNENPNVPKRYLVEAAFKLVPKNVPGGVILERRPFSLRR